MGILIFSTTDHGPTGKRKAFKKKNERGVTRYGGSENNTSVCPARSEKKWYLASEL
jgi:hypothetical protein